MLSPQFSGKAAARGVVLGACCAGEQTLSAASVTNNMVVCCAHFRLENYVHTNMMVFRMVCRSQTHVRLTAGVVPSVHTGPPSVAACGSGVR